MTQSMERRTLSELITRYELEPSLDDVYVEGVFDKEVFESHFAKKPFEKIIYEIDTIDVPAGVLIKHGLTEGNKQRVIATAKELSVLSDDCTYICLADKDLDHWLDKLDSVPRLRWTRHCSIELHFLSEGMVHQFLVVIAKCQLKDFSAFYESFIDSLKKMYALRVADAAMQLNLSWIPFDKYLKAGVVINFDVDRYIDNSLISNSKSKLNKEFRLVYDKSYLMLCGDCRDFIRGHDYVELLVFAINKFKGIKEVAHRTTIERMFLLVAETVESIGAEIDHQ